MRNDYNTKQKDLILSVIKKQSGEFVVKDIYDKLNGKVGLTTIYRLVDKLVEEKQISKSIGKDKNTYYQYLETCQHENHFFLKCELCGKIDHIDCDCIKDLSNHIIKEHNFKLDKSNIIINGICKNCR